MMQSMFEGATAFNQPLANWNVGRVIDMQRMFSRATAFNQPVVTWQWKEACCLSQMFADADMFRQHLCRWKVPTHRLHQCPFKMTSRNCYRMAGIDLEFHLSISDPDHLQQFLRAHDMVLTLRNAAHYWTLPLDLLRELTLWIGVDVHTRHPSGTNTTGDVHGLRHSGQLDCTRNHVCNAECTNRPRQTSHC
jgi:surface protein